MLPAGRLREAWTAVKPDHIGVVLSGDPATAPEVPKWFRAGKVFRAFREEPAILDPGGGPVDPGAAGDAAVVILSGIARPAGFEATCARAGLKAVASVRAPDHHWYDEDDVALMRGLMAQYGCERIVTTEKDLVKLPEALRERAWTVRSDVALAEPEAFWREIRARLRERG